MNPNMRNEKLRAVFENLGFTNVRMVISSGNVLFEADQTDVKALEMTIDQAWPEQLGFSNTTIIRSQDELQQLVSNDPFKGMEDMSSSRLNVTFLKDEQAMDLQFPYHANEKGYTILDLQDRAVYSVINLSGAKTPDVMARLEKQFGKEITTRTWKTDYRILKKK